MGKLKEMIGQKFGRLTVLARATDNVYKKPMYVCSCECGGTKTIHGKLLRIGRTQSCGCLRYERLRASITTHGQSFTKTHNAWCALRDRCNNPNGHAYKNYGGRGISVCERWNKFENFLSDMGHKPTGKSIDRIDVNGNYEPSNCRWATPIEQANNVRSNVLLTYLGVTHTEANWSRQLGIPRTTIHMRRMKGQSVEQILGTPKHVVARVRFKGKNRTYPEIAKLVGMSYITLRWRLRKGFTLAEAVS